MKPVIHPAILSGGSGTRLWPVSRADHPKQLLAMVGERTMLQETAERVTGRDGYAPPMVICNEAHRFVVGEQLHDIGIEPTAIILEPVGRNSAPAAAIAALRVLETDPDGLVLLLASDHVVDRPEVLAAAIEKGAVAAAKGRLVTFGITPSKPETGYGYIEIGAEIPSAPGVHIVDRFVEKPNLATAETYLSGGAHLWNSGMFLFQAARMIEELERHAPNIVSACRMALTGATRDLDFLRLPVEAFGGAPAISIDYAVMEKTEHAAVVPVDPGWSDVGSWTALHEIAATDADGNALKGDVVTVDTTGSLVRADGRLVAVLGMKDTIVVETADAVLVAARDRAQDVKAIVDRLKAEDRREAIAHARVIRPWGAFASIDTGDGWQVKRIEVAPGGRLSLQRHEKRAEHWVVLSGVAKVTRGPSVDRLDVVHLYPDQSIDIPLGWVHRLENPGTEPLAIIEVQSGAYLGEDDIVRFEDIYGRG